MSQKLLTCCRCNKLFSFNTRYLHRVELVIDGGREITVFKASCLYCGAENKVEVEK